MAFGFRRVKRTARKIIFCHVDSTLLLVTLHFAHQDSQEFLRCLMDQLHEELKEPLPEPSDQSGGGGGIALEEVHEEDNHSQSDDFQSCESCGSSERADNEAQCTNMLIEDTNEAESLIPEQDEVQANREWQKEKNMINDLYRAGVNGVLGGSTGVDMDKDVDTTTEITPIISSQGAIKLQSRNSGNLRDTKIKIYLNRLHHSVWCFTL